MQHSFEWLPPRFRLPLLAVLFVITLVIGNRLRVQGKPLRTDAAPNGMLSLQFAWTGDRARRIIASWKQVLDVARRQIRLDFGFLLVYPLFLALACAVVAGSPQNRWAGGGEFLSWAVLLALPLDAIENSISLRMLGHGPSPARSRAASFAAIVKWLLVVATVLYLVGAGVLILVGWPR